MNSKASIFVPLFTLLSALAYTRAAGGQTIIEPKWPQPFAAGAGKSAGFAFFVTQAGPISVSVQSAAPLLVTLIGPLPKPIHQPGTGNVQLAYVATAADVQKGYLWGVRIDSSAPQSVQGTISVSHPPVNMSLVSGQVRQLQQRSAQLRASIAASQAKMSQALAAQQQPRQQAQQQLAAAQALKTQQLLNSIGAPATPGVQTRGLSTATATIRPGTTIPPGTVINPIAGPADLRPPAISSLSVGEGQPSDPVLITGSFFRSTGQVHFVVNPGMDLVAAVDRWSDTQIVAHVPQASGIQRYVGSVYVTVPPVGLTRQGLKLTSAPQQFIFDPQLDSQVLQVPPWIQSRFVEQNVANPNSSCLAYYLCQIWYQPTYSMCPEPIPNCTADHPWGTSGDATSGNDEWYLTSTLMNGWVTDSASLSLCTWYGAASIVTSRPGTSSLYTKVQWSNFGDDACYQLQIKIKGPLGTSPF
jgi:hypothetical protein